MLIEVAVKGFRCFDASEWHALPFAKETIIMGPNNSGKSALLSVVDFYRASFPNFPSAQFGVNSEVHSWGQPSEFYHPSVYQALLREEAAGVGFQLTIAAAPKCTIEVERSGGWKRTDHWEGPKDETAVREALQQTWHLGPIRPELPAAQNVGQSGIPQQPILPGGQNVIQFLLERYTSRDPNWDEAEYWLRAIDPQMSLLSVPLRGQVASIETGRTYADGEVAAINIADQGTGMQSVCSVVAALVFSPPGSTIIIEEPEAFLHPRSQEVVVDLMNKAVNEWGKQVIATTHSWDIILPFISDIGEGQDRGQQHLKADPQAFSLVMIDDDHSVRKYNLKGKPFMTVRDDAKKLWG